MGLLVFLGLVAYGAYSAALSLGWAAVALLFLLALPFGAYLDWSRGRRKRRLHPDNNFHSLPLLNARGFGPDGEPLL